MSRRILLYVVLTLLLIIAGALITGQFDIHPMVGIIVALVIVALTAVFTKKGDE